MTYNIDLKEIEQRERESIPTIFRTMREEGCPVPVFEIEAQSVTCILKAQKRD